MPRKGLSDQWWGVSVPLSGARRQCELEGLSEIKLIEYHDLRRKRIDALRVLSRNGSPPVHRPTNHKPRPHLRRIFRVGAECLDLPRLCVARTHLDRFRVRQHLSEPLVGSVNMMECRKREYDGIPNMCGKLGSMFQGYFLSHQLLERTCSAFSCFVSTASGRRTGHMQHARDVVAEVPTSTNKDGGRRHH